MSTDLEDTGPLTIPANFPAVRERERPGPPPPPRHAAPPPPRHQRLLLRFLGGAAAGALIAGTVVAFIQVGPAAITRTLTQDPAVLAPAAPPAHRPYIPATLPEASPAQFTHPAGVLAALPARVHRRKQRRHVTPATQPRPVTTTPAPHHTVKPVPTPSLGSTPTPTQSQSPSPSPSPDPDPSPSDSASPSPSPSDTATAPS